MLLDIASRAYSMYKINAVQVIAVQLHRREVAEVVIHSREQSRRWAPQKLDRPPLGAESRRG